MWRYFTYGSLPTKFGLVSIVLSLILAPLLLYYGEMLGLDSEVLLQLVAPEVFVGLFDLATMSNPGVSVTIMVMAIPLSIFVGKAFVMGWLLGILYEVLRKKNLQIFFFVILTIAIVFGGKFLVDRSISTEMILKTAATAEDCSKHSGSEGYYAPQCFLGLAIKTGDVSACDNLKTEWGPFSAGTCYASFAINQRKPALCDIIENSEARFDCYRSFRLCEKMTDMGYDPTGTDSCWITKAGMESNRSYCDHVKERERLKECDCTVHHGAFNYSAISQCAKI